MAYQGDNPKAKSRKYTPQSADPSNPVEGQVFRSDGTSRAEGLWEYRGGVWKQVGSGAGQINFYSNGDAENHSDTSKFSAGNNATFDGGGTPQGTFSISTTAADLINGVKVFKYVLHATPGTSDDDYVASEAINIPQGYRGRQLYVQFQYKYDGADDDIKWVVKDEDNSNILTSDAELLKISADADNVAKQFSLSFHCPSDCSQIKIGPQVITHATGSENLIWDDAIVSSDFTNTTNIEETQTINHSAANSTLTDRSGEVEFNLSNVQNAGANILSVEDDSGNTRTKFIAIGPCRVGVHWSSDKTTSGGAGTILVNDVIVAQGTENAGANLRSEVAAELNLSAGDFITLSSTGTGIPSNANAAYVYITAKADAPTFVLAGKGSYSYDASIPSAGTSTTSEGPEDFIESVSRPLTGRYVIVWKTGFFTENPCVTAASASASAGRNAVVENPTTTGVTIFHDNLGTLENGAINIHVARQGNDAKNNNSTHVAVPVPKTMYVRPVDPATATYSSPAGTTSYKTHTIHSLEGDIFGSQSSNQLTLGSGEYRFQCSGASQSGNGALDFRLRNITDSSDEKEFIDVSVNNDGANTSTSFNTVWFTVTITKTTVFEFQTKSSSASGNELFSVAAIDKVK